MPHGLHLRVCDANSKLTAYPPTMRYSTRSEFSNLKNSLKSLGSWIVAIVDLSKELEGAQPLGGRAGAPIVAVVARVAQARDGQPCAVDFAEIQRNFLHVPILPRRRAKAHYTRFVVDTR